MAARKAPAIWDPAIVRSALINSLYKFSPRVLAHNPVMFVVEVTAAVVTVILCADLFRAGAGLVKFELQIALWLWFTVGFANFAEAMAEGRGKAQADNLRRMRTETQAWGRSAGRGRRRNPERRRSDRRRCRSQRGRDNGRIRPGNPRKRRGSERGDRGHYGYFRLDQSANYS